MASRLSSPPISRSGRHERRQWFPDSCRPGAAAVQPCLPKGSHLSAMRSPRSSILVPVRVSNRESDWLANDDADRSNSPRPPPRGVGPRRKRPPPLLNGPEQADARRAERLADRPIRNLARKLPFIACPVPRPFGGRQSERAKGGHELNGHRLGRIRSKVGAVFGSLCAVLANRRRFNKRQPQGSPPPPLLCRTVGTDCLTVRRACRVFPGRQGGHMR